MATKRPLGLDLDKLGQFVRAQRQLAGYSLRQLGELTDVSNAYLSQLENGKHEPSIRVLRQVAEALNISADTLMQYMGFPRADTESDDPAPPGGPGATEAAISLDPRLSDDQREALLSVYRSYVGE